MAIAVTTSGCLITQPVHFDEPPNSPPAIYEVEPSPMHRLDEVLQLTPVAVTSDAGVGAMMFTAQSFDAVVFDADVDQPLQFQVLVDHAVCRTCVSTMNGVLPPSASMTDRARRRLTFTVDGSLLGGNGMAGRCHSVRLLVSGAFVPGTQDAMESGDLAAVTWWVASSPMAGGAVDMTGCP